MHPGMLEGSLEAPIARVTVHTFVKLVEPLSD